MGIVVRWSLSDIDWPSEWHNGERPCEMRTMRLAQWQDLSVLDYWNHKSGEVLSGVGIVFVIHRQSMSNRKGELEWYLERHRLTWREVDWMWWWPLWSAVTMRRHCFLDRFHLRRQTDKRAACDPWRWKETFLTSSVKSIISKRCLKRPALLSGSSSVPSMRLNVEPS